MLMMRIPPAGAQLAWLTVIFTVACTRAAAAACGGAPAPSRAQAPATAERMVEWTFESRKAYADPFNEVEVDVVFSKDGQRWRVPAFWHGKQRWTVRFAPPTPGEYAYRVESTDRA